MTKEPNTILVFRDMKLFPSMNILLREHFTKRTKRKETLMWLIKQQKPNSYKGKVTIEYTRCAKQLQDWDNHCASFKVIGDALVSLGIIVDDNPKIVHRFIPQQEKVKKDDDVKIIVVIKQYV